MMKDEEKRQEREGNTPATASTTAATSSSNNPLNDEGGTATGETPQATSSRNANSPGTSTLPTTPGGSEESASVVEFFVDDADGFEGDSKYLLKSDGTPITVPLKLHPVLTGKSAFEVEKALCHTALRTEPPTCISLDPTAQEAGRQGSRDQDGVNDSLTFSLPLDPELSVGSAYFLRVRWSKRDDEDGPAGFSYSKVYGEASAGYNDGRFLSDWTAPLSFTEEESVTRNGVMLSITKGDEFAPPEVGREALNEAGRSIDNASGVPSGTTAAPSATPSTDPRGGAGDTSDATPTDTPSSGGLSHGAIIGIGVAAGIIGLLAIGLLVWFFCLRNRRRHGTKDHGPYAAPDHQASEYMVNKETTGAHVTESPHSPYSDDGSLAHPQGQGSSLAQVQQQQQANQYSDAPPIAAPVPRSAAQQAGDRPGSGSGTRSGTPGGGHSVSHLIEEGMTEADIRRLEEEERALDDAIERAGHGRR